MTKVRSSLKQDKPGHFLKKWRKARGLTQEGLAELTGLTHGMISQLERGDINYVQNTWEALASALECSPGELLSVDPTNRNDPFSIFVTLRPETRQRALDMLEDMRIADQAKGKAA